eukprot:766583-Hanusia_phi.AAC.2
MVERSILSRSGDAWKARALSDGSMRCTELLFRSSPSDTCAPVTNTGSSGEIGAGDFSSWWNNQSSWCGAGEGLTREDILSSNSSFRCRSLTCPGRLLVMLRPKCMSKIPLVLMHAIKPVKSSRRRMNAFRTNS